MILDRLEIINEEFHSDAVEPAAYDRLLADGWRHFGTHFFRLPEIFKEPAADAVSKR